MDFDSKIEMINYVIGNCLHIRQLNMSPNRIDKEFVEVVRSNILSNMPQVDIIPQY